jgi:hypothetical protein
MNHCLNSLCSWHPQILERTFGSAHKKDFTKNPTLQKTNTTPLTHQQSKGRDTMGFDTARFLTQPEPEYLCTICLGVFEDPVQTSCEHYFCRACIVTSLAHQALCPIDRTSLAASDLKPLPRGMRNVYLRMNLRCEFHARGCRETMEMEKMSPHARSCGYSPVHCPNSGCRFHESNRDAVNQQDLSKHVDSCEWRLVRCEAPECQAHFPLVKREDHESVCEFREGECRQGCGKRLFSRDLQYHIREECAKTIKKCDVDGCSYECARGDTGAWQNHFSSSLQLHFRLVSAFSQDLHHFLSFCSNYFSNFILWVSLPASQAKPPSCWHACLAQTFRIPHFSPFCFVLSGLNPFCCRLCKSKTLWLRYIHFLFFFSCTPNFFCSKISEVASDKFFSSGIH